MYQAIKLPLRVHLLLSSEREAVELFIVAQVAEHRFHSSEASAVCNAPFRAVNPLFHFVGVTHAAIGLALEECHLSHLGFLRGEQAAVSMLARYAVALCAFESDCGTSADNIKSMGSDSIDLMQESMVDRNPNDFEQHGRRINHSA